MPHLEKGPKRKAVLKFYKASSVEFSIAIDEKIISKQERSQFFPF